MELCSLALLSHFQACILFFLCRKFPFLGLAVFLWSRFLFRVPIFLLIRFRLFFCDCGCEFFDSVLVDSAVVDDSVVESGDVSVLTPDHGVGVKTVAINCFV